jgi:1,4-dihydroxy-2-naphthoate octaprenyltransferase
MNAKMKQCFTPHVLMHSLFGLGIGLILADVWSGVAKWWIGVIILVVATVLDMMRNQRFIQMRKFCQGTTNLLK